MGLKFPNGPPRTTSYYSFLRTYEAEESEKNNQFFKHFDLTAYYFTQKANYIFLKIKLLPYGIFYFQIC